MASSSSDDEPDQTPPAVPSTTSSVSQSPKGPILPLQPNADHPPLTPSMTTGPASESRAPAEASPASSSRYSLRPRRKINYSGSKKEQETEQSVVIPIPNDDIEADIITMTGSTPPSRPRRHPTNVRKAIDQLSPGQQLTNITEEKYNLPDKRYRKV